MSWRPRRISRRYLQLRFLQERLELAVREMLVSLMVLGPTSKSIFAMEAKERLQDVRIIYADEEPDTLPVEAGGYRVRFHP